MPVPRSPKRYRPIVVKEGFDRRPTVYVGMGENLNGRGYHHLQGEGTLQSYADPRELLAEMEDPPRTCVGVNEKGFIAWDRYGNFAAYYPTASGALAALRRIRGYWLRKGKPGLITTLLSPFFV